MRVGKGKILFIIYSTFWCNICNRLNGLAVYSENITRFKNIKFKICKFQGKKQQQSCCIY